MSSGSRHTSAPSKGSPHHTEAIPSSSSSTDITSPLTLRSLVLDYLLHHCYLDTAQAFVMDGTRQDYVDDMEATERLLSTASTGQLPLSAQTPPFERRNVHPLASLPLSERDCAMEAEGNPHAATAPQPHVDNQHDGEASKLRATSSSLEAIGGELTVEDVRRVRLRQEIRDNILNGQIKNATDLLNANFPAVLSGDMHSATHKGADTSAHTSSFSTSSKAPASHGRSRARSRSSSRQVGIPSGRNSLEPEHLSLNLQIQAFVESVRTANMPQVQPQPSTTFAHSTSQNGFAASGNTASQYHHHNLPHSTPGIAAASLSRSASPAPSSASSASSSCASHPSSGVPSALQTALASAQLLYASVQRLKNDACREIYQRELEKVTAILAYKDLERSPLKKYLDVKRRVDLADQINSAIMCHPSQPLIECAVRQTTFVWSELHNEKIPVPVDHPVFNSGISSSMGLRESSAAGMLAGFPGTEIPTISSWIPSSAITGGLTNSTVQGGDKKSKAKVPSTFTLSSFLAER